VEVLRERRKEAGAERKRDEQAQGSCEEQVITRIGAAV